MNYSDCLFLSHSLIFIHMQKECNLVFSVDWSDLHTGKVRFNAGGSTSYRVVWGIAIALTL